MSDLRNLIGSKPSSVEDMAINFACSMGFLAIADRMF